MGRYTGFEPRTIRFLEQLRDNNDREWFKANKQRYEEDVLDVALRFIISMQEPLRDIAPRFTAVPTRVGGSLMRVYRDTRFSKNKLPYKTNIGIQFRHEQAKDVHSPGYYVHIEPDEVFIGVGMWRPGFGFATPYPRPHRGATGRMAACAGCCGIQAPVRACGRIAHAAAPRVRQGS